MRVDLYSSSDRASEALAAYRENQASQYYSTICAGSFVTSLLLLFFLSWLFPKSLDASEITRKTILYFKSISSSVGVWSSIGNIFMGVMGMMLDGISVVFQNKMNFGIGISIYVVLFCSSIFIGHVCAFFQGLMFSVISGFIIISLVAAFIELFSPSTSFHFWCSFGVGIIVFICVFIMGILGAFLPDA